MPQGKMKTKIKLPDTVKMKKKMKGRAIVKRKNAPIAPNRAKNAQVQKLKSIISKSVNATAEQELRAIALDGKQSLLSKNTGSQSKPVAFNKSKKKK